jgi:hypothetical protein
MFLALPPAWVQVSQGPAGEIVWAGPIPNRFVLAARRTALVYLPPSASATGRYRVVFLLQGFPPAAATISGMDLWQPLPLDRFDVDVIVDGVFDANVRILRVMDEVVAIRRLLESYGEEDEN